MATNKRKANLIGPNLEYIDSRHETAPKRQKTTQQANKQKNGKTSNNKNDVTVQAQSVPSQDTDGCQQMSSQPEAPVIHHPVLSAYFQTLIPLRQYLLLALKSSRSLATSLISRKKRLLRFKSDGSKLHNDVVRLLDTTIVGVSKPIDQVDGSDAFVERALAERLNATQDEKVASSQDELVDCAIAILLQKARTSGNWANSPLASGYRIIDNNSNSKTATKFRQFGVDVISLYPNPHSAEFRNQAWKAITEITGQETILKLLSMQGENEGAVLFPLSDKVRRGYRLSLVSTKCYQQYLGSALSEIQLEKKTERVKAIEDNEVTTKVTFTRKQKTLAAVDRKPSEIRFARAKMFYAKPANNKNSEPKTGLPHIHVLNRFYNFKKRDNNVHVLKYIFPRAFGLHNVFTSVVNKQDTVHSFKDYTLREDEIDLKISRAKDNRRLKKILRKKKEPEPGCPDNNDDLHHGYVPPSPLPDIDRKTRKAYETVENLPQRFRGGILRIVGELIRLQRRCNYHPLLQHYCPSSLIDSSVPDPRPRVPLPPPSTQVSPMASMCFKTQVSNRRTSGGRQGSKRTSLQGATPITPLKRTDPGDFSTQDPMLLYSTSSHSVYTFIRAVISNIIPLEFWGTGKSVLRTREVFFGHLEKFVKLRRYETLSLHDVMQGFKLTDFTWLHQKTPNQNGKIRLDAADMKHCTSLLAEFLYYLFDSLVIPLIRAHFYVTESATEKNRTCYFRHDIWRKLTIPHLNKLISTMFTDITSQRARAIMQRRAAKFSTVRLLPKATGVRVLSNLKRRPMEVESKTGRRVLGKSINQILKPNHVALTFEKNRQPQAVGAALFSMGEILKKITEFKDRLTSQGVFGKQKLYFVKVDVTSAFDTIPQQRLLEVIEQLYMENMYKIRRQGRIALGSGRAGEAKPKILFPQIGEPADNEELYAQRNKNHVENFGMEKKSLIFVDRVACVYHERDALIRELREHVVNNFVQIGKRFYRQSLGIPQGSVMSTLLCNLFYADLEARELPFTQAKTGLLMRLVDDFLFITTNRDHAKRFSDAMHRGIPEYGVVVNLSKSLVNFEIDFDGRKIERVLGDSSGFPYCGTLINEKSLEIKRDWARRDGLIISNILTVDYGSKPGLKMVDKVSGGWKLLSSAIYLNTTINSRPTVVTNLYWSFVDSAMKFYSYYRSLSSHSKHIKRQKTHHEGKAVSRQINEKQILNMISEFMSLAYTLIMSRENREYDGEGNVIPKEGLIGRIQVRWLVAKAFLRVLGKKQTLFPKVLNWLEGCVKASADKVDRVFYKAVDDEEINEIFETMKY
ncbi:hypothetical protein TWF730_000340 [Orbilia blumenaviensis]|uniref:Telomerase reverse transcriptase n=1 Tax=Orbilia blumenaviensis TaxID=1796055 RepID=A0AAV9VNA0_9PEZI